MAKVANVFVNIPVKSIAKAYSYFIPEELDFVGVGWRVLVSFGNRKVEGFIVEIFNQEDLDKLKPILDVIDREAWFNDKMIALSYWLADYYLCSVAEAMRLFMPGKSGSKIKPIYIINEKYYDARKLSGDMLIIYQYIEKHKNVELPLLAKVFSTLDVTAILANLLKQEAIIKDYLTQKKANVKLETYLKLATALSEEMIKSFNKKPAQKKLLEYLNGLPEQSIKELKSAGFSLPTIREVSKSEFIEVTEKQLLRDSYRNFTVDQNNCILLTSEQQSALNSIKQSIEKTLSEIFLVHGITGSGKTQVYIEAVKLVRRQNKKAIILVPEIGLTGQMIQRFKTYFPEEVIVMHSRLSISERNDAIVKIRNDEAAIVIGARSAIFTPVDNLGIIIIDEEHDASYKQDESPRYHTIDIAKKLACLHQATVLLGSATPSIESFYAANHGEYKLLTLNHRVGNAKLPMIQIVDMRQELRLGRRNIISQDLKNLIEKTLAKNEQIIILLNRRGFSTFIMCRECGHVLTCDHCTLPLTYHKNGVLQCHFCDTTEVVPDICPKCASRYIKYFGSGTEKLEEELHNLFSEAKVVRMDRDTTGKKFAHAKILEDFSQKRYDILLGTQMVAKGHDIENVTAVGIISADSSLNLPDFRAAERCFSLITQAAGRAGRGNVQGNVVVQTYNPEHYAVQFGANHDYISFYKEEIQLRKQLGYPPYSKLIKLIVQNTEETIAIKNANALINALKARFTSDQQQILGPVPSSIPKLREQYRFIILIKSTAVDEIKTFLKSSKLYLRMDITIDVNPLNVT